MSRRRVRAGIALAAIWGLAAAAPAREGFRYRREIAVAEPGWVGVRLDGNALVHAGVSEDFTYVSTADGAFLEWMEGKTLPGVAALRSVAASPGDRG